MPAPNNPNDVFNSIPNVHQTVPNGSDYDDQFTVRFDHHINNNQNLSIYDYFFDSRSSQPFTRFEALTPNLLEGFGNTNATRSQQINISHAWTVSNNSVNEFRFTYFRNSQGKFLHPSHSNNVIDSCSGAAQAFCFNGNFDVPGIFTPDPKLGITPGLAPTMKVFRLLLSPAPSLLVTITKANCRRWETRCSGRIASAKFPVRIVLSSEPTFAAPCLTRPCTSIPTGTSAFSAAA